MQEYEILCNYQTWKVQASSIRVAVGRVIKAEERRLEALGQETGKKLKLTRLEISWKKGN